MFYEQIVLKQTEGHCASPCDMAEQVISYLEERGYLQAWIFGRLKLLYSLFCRVLQILVTDPFPHPGNRSFPAPACLFRLVSRISWSSDPFNYVCGLTQITYICRKSYLIGEALVMLKCNKTSGALCQGIGACIIVLWNKTSLRTIAFLDCSVFAVVDLHRFLRPRDVLFARENQCKIWLIFTSNSCKRTVKIISLCTLDTYIWQTHQQ